MIIDKTGNLMKYESVLPCLSAAVKAIRALPSPEPGRYEFDGGFFTVQEGYTRPAGEAEFEYHKKYIDVQIFLSGSEYMAWHSEDDDLAGSVPFDAQKDIGFKKGSMEHSIRISEGMFYAVYPRDLHAPCLHFDQPTAFKKIVVKLPADRCDPQKV